MRKKIFCTLFAASLWATVNEPLRWEIFSGYRNDRIHWHLQEPGEEGALTLSEVYRDVQYWLNGLVLKAIHRDLVVFVRGAYGAFGKGKLTQRYEPMNPADPHIHSSTDGWCADASGYVGYAVNLTADRPYKVLLVPLIGYAGYFEQIHKMALSEHFRLVWNGWFIGAQWIFETSGPAIFTAGWSYNMMHNRAHTHVGETSLKTSSGGNKGQLGWAQMDWRIGSLWRIGLGGEMLYLTTRIVDAALSSGPDQKFKLRWIPISGWVQTSRTF
ncbi:MAG: hypothetical protein KGQ49_03990 [Verrucomicrobia bacterium]|nr:hypothetical protein [Verrucomicrobiota bacterium]MBU6446540.1 hypothetical protein [Verrucomicrobiota bacterium]MDE3046942.1 hypothetical protein [Verrucomicrobiota bacterium]